jgi:hypothetical protein
MAAAKLKNDPLLTALLDYWEKKRGNRDMPRRRDIDPLEMPTRLLPYLQLIELGERGRLRFRLIGTAIVDAMGRDATGRYLDDVMTGEHKIFTEKFYRTTLGAGRPAVGSCSLHRDGASDLATLGLATPLSENGREADMLLTATSFRSLLGRGAVPPLAGPEIEQGDIVVL